MLWRNNLFVYISGGSYVNDKNKKRNGTKKAFIFMQIKSSKCVICVRKLSRQDDYI